MDLLDLFVKIGVKDEASDKVSSLGSKLKSGLATAGKVAAAGVGLVTSAAGAAAGALSALEGATEEYRVAQGKLNTAFDAAGFSADAAREAYYGFYGILGDTDTATEASQLLAKLVENEEDIVDWTDIAAGVFGTFGDSLPIEGLIEASNETAKVGTVTGVLADALNWAGISEDDFNAKLAACSSESERNQLIMETLSATYDDAASAFYQNNQALVKSRDAQTMLMDAMSKLATTIQTVKTGLISDFLPSIVSVAEALNGMLSGTEGASEQFATAVEGLVAVAVEKLPQFLDFGVQIIMALVNGIVASIPSLVAAVPQVVTSIAEALMGLLPQILDVGVQLLDQFATGVETGLPDLVSRLPQVVEAILEFLTDNLPAFLDKGVEVLSQFAFGIIDSIPVLVAELPQIIRSITEFFVENFPLIVKSGGELLGQLLVGIIGAIPEIALQLPEVITAIVGALQAGWDQLKQVGAYLLEGLWAGIGDKVEWLKSKVSGVVDTIKSWFTGSDGFDTHSPSKWSMSVMEYVMEGLAIGAQNRAGEVMETVEDIVSEIKSRFETLTDAFDIKQDISDLEYQLWESGEGRNATEAEKYAKQLEMLAKQQQNQESVVEAALAAYQAVVAQYGDNTQESYEYQKTLLEEQLELQNLQNEIYDTIAAMQELSKTQSGMSSVSFGESGLGTATSATINATEAVADREISASFTANLVTPDGSKLASWQLPYLIKAGSAAGTPIAEAQRA